MTTQAFGQYLTLTGSQTLRFQNYWIGENVSYGGDIYGFLPFAFSGATVTKSGDNQPAALAFPNNSLARGWAEMVIRDQWLVTCRAMLINPDDRNSPTLLTSYTAQVVGGGWSDTSIEVRMASVLDAVGADVPRKKLTKQLVGNLPLTSSVRLQ
jgi:hypothetical protein